MGDGAVLERVSCAGAGLELELALLLTGWEVTTMGVTCGLAVVAASSCRRICLCPCFRLRCGTLALLVDVVTLDEVDRMDARDGDAFRLTR